ncbi:MAG: 3-deoxy-manno-octulosonate-8-phosphatase KdsC [Nitrospirota bacterium]|nr:3-deoxy-manno-octulosonate-8-phosphatase KdsC [Nitrospirota bacterium]
MKGYEIKRKELMKIAQDIKLLILDVDGVLTDGSIILDNEGNEFKAFHVRDGHGIKMLIKAGIHVALITGRYSKVVERRAHELGITEIYQKSHDKRVAYRQLVKKYSVDEKDVAYIGDDIVDIPLLKRAGFSVVVADADDEVKAAAMLTTKKRGGKGAVREICDFLLKAKGLWKDIIDEYSKV